MKRVFYVAGFLLLCFCVNISSTYAICTSSDLSELKELAKKVEVSYEFDEESKMFNLTAYNLNPKFYVALNQVYFFYQSDKMNFGSFSNDSKMKVIIYGSISSGCYEEKLYSFEINLPYYNKYSEYEECLNKESVDICKKWYNTSKLSEEQFKNEINKKESNVKKSFLENVKLLFVNYLIYIIVGVVVIVLSLLIFIFVRKRNRKYS